MPAATPPRSIAFSGVKAGSTVVDIIPGAAYWTRIFTGVVGPTGHVWAVWPAAAEGYAEKGKPALEARGLTNVIGGGRPRDPDRRQAGRSVLDGALQASAIADRYQAPALVNERRYLRESGGADAR